MLPQFLSLPSVKAFAQAIVNDLGQRRSVLVILPQQINLQRMQDLIAQELSHEGLWWENVFVPPSNSLDGTLQRAAWLLESLQIPKTRWRGNRYLRDFLSIEELPDVIFLVGLDNIPDGHVREWLDFIKQWHQASHQARNTGKEPRAICVFTQAEQHLGDLPPADLYLEVYRWWGFPPKLEMRLACRQQDNPHEITPRDIWREHMLSSLIGGDWRLIERLWNIPDMEFSQLIRTLTAYAREKGWSKQMLRELGWKADLIGSRSRFGMLSVPPKQIEPFWIRGIVCASPEYGIEAHPAALAILDKQEEVKHRLWRAQTAIFLPRVEEIRRSVCKAISREKGKGWALRWNTPETQREIIAIRQNPLAIQLGYLETLLRDMSHFRAQQRYRFIISQARRIRNQIAHYQIASFQDFESLIDEFRKINV